MLVYQRVNIPRTQNLFLQCQPQCFPDQQPIGISEITGSALRSGTMLQLVIGPADATQSWPFGGDFMGSISWGYNMGLPTIYIYIYIILYYIILYYIILYYIILLLDYIILYYIKIYYIILNYIILYIRIYIIYYNLYIYIYIIYLSP